MALNQKVESIVVLKVGSGTIVKALKSAIVGHILARKTVYLDAIGAGANYAATKSMISARTELIKKDIRLLIEPTFTDLEIEKPADKKVKTAIRWILSNSEI